ncbi:hypothetical protein [Amycolatopsis sp. NPDC059657]|uniref:hypothetical protein n=1 Tax=Amycolatopsis sp. NPDC059657 TaxID=3346899 RepID=UPI0036708944
MTAAAHPPSGLSKATWTDADFQFMGWHDCRIRALGVTKYDDDTVPPTRLLLDLDYIVRWVDPVPPEKHFTFWIAPATLVFEQAWDITGHLGPLHEPLGIDDVHRLASPDDHAYPAWHHIQGQNFDIRLRAHGYRQYLRTPPHHVSRQVLTMAQRNGINFGEQSFV